MNSCIILWSRLYEKMEYCGSDLRLHLKIKITNVAEVMEVISEVDRRNNFAVHKKIEHVCFSKLIPFLKYDGEQILPVFSVIRTA